MDNASKALIMAGAILISLALVGLGVYIFSISSGLQQNAGSTMDAMAAQTTNKMISTYEGTRRRGSEVKELMNLVNTLNSQDVFPIDLEYDRSGTGALGSGDTPSANSWYTVTMTDAEGNDGYLDTIKIVPAS